MAGEKLYRIKTKEGAHINEKFKADGSRAALQFDKENGLLGPVDLIEVDESEYARVAYREPEYFERNLGQVIIEDVVIPAASEALTEIVYRAVESSMYAFGNWMTQKAVPAVKAKGAKLFEKVREAFMAKESDKSDQGQVIVTVNQGADVMSNSVKTEGSAVVHTQDEIDLILNNMKFAALYIAAGIRELSNTVIEYDGSDPQKAFELQQKLKELSSDEVIKTIEFMLEDKNRDLLDQATIQLFEAFRHSDLIVEGEAVPISTYLQLAS